MSFDRARLLPLSLAFALVASFLDARAATGVTSEPLTPRSGPSGATLFTPLPPEQTGVSVENRYADPRMWGDRYQELVYGAIGTGVAIGDYDNDGRPDLLVVSKVEGYRLFRNLGGWRFEDVTAAAGLGGSSASWWEQGVSWARRVLGRETAETPAETWHQGVTFVDVNNDGWLDLYICRFDAPNRLYINQGNGTFREEAAARGLAVRDGSGMASFADFDRDGWLDVYLQTNFLNANQSPQGQRDYLFRNNGDGTFTEVTERAGIRGVTAGHSATWWDFDGDGWPDLYVANDFAHPDQLYRNNRDGTFTNVIDAVMPYTPYYAMGADLGDVNNDGHVDFFVADMAGTTHEREHRGMAGSRSRAQENPESHPAAPQYMRNVLYLATGTPHFREAAGLAGLHATDWTWSVRLEDLDNDGRLDLHVTNGMNREFHNADLLERIMRAEDLAEPRRLMRASPVMAEGNLAFRNRGDLAFEEVSTAWGLDQVGVSFGAAFGDLDGDGDLDLIFTNYEGNVTLLRNDSPNGNRLMVALRGTHSNRFGIGATIRIDTSAGTQVRQLTLARGYMSSSEPVAHFGLGEISGIERLVVRWPSGHEQVLENVGVNQRLTIQEPDTAPPALRAAPVAAPDPGWFYEVGGELNAHLLQAVETPEGTLAQPLLPRRFNRRGPALAIGDLTGDGQDEWLIGGTTRAATRILTRTTTGAYTFAPLAPPGPTSDGPILLFDATGNGANDVLVTRGGANLPAHDSGYQPQLWLNEGHGRLRPAAADALPSLPISAGAAAAADFDRDGAVDVFIGGRLLPGQYPLPARSALLRNVGGRFVDVTAQLAPGLADVGLVTAALWSDVDGDGWVDLLVALEWGGIRYWRNLDGRGFEDQSAAAGFAAAGTGWWTSLLGGDFNGDGRIDYVAGNVGLNTPYDASPEYPAMLFAGNFRGAGQTMQLVEGYYQGGRLLPRRIRRDLGTEIPAVLRRFPRNDGYAQATLPEILGEPALANAQRFAATEFRSGIFLSQPDGTFRFHPLPRIAQIAPFQGMVAADFDGDGSLDLFAVQNDFSPIPMVGRFGGGIGQLLRGDGRGGFVPVPPAESGLVVPGDAKALALTDLDDDGWPDLVVTRNNDTSLVFQHRGQATTASLRVDLRPARGSSAIAGARVTAIRADGGQAVAETYAGGGYTSQSTSAVFFGQLSGREIRHLDIRWPNGSTTRHNVPAGAATITVRATQN
jgi:enediyne biosynthesis protein E4